MIKGFFKVTDFHKMFIFLDLCLTPLKDFRFKKLSEVEKVIVLFLEKTSSLSPKYCFSPIKKLPFLNSLLGLIFKDYCEFAFKYKTFGKKENRKHPKRVLKQ